MNTIGSFAEKLLLEEIDQIKDGNSIISSVATEENQKDIMGITVPDSFIQAITEGKAHKYTPVLEDQIEDPVSEVEEKETPELSDLISRFNKLVIEATELFSLIKENTSVGRLSTKQAAAMAGTPHDVLHKIQGYMDPEKVDVSLKKINHKKGWKAKIMKKKNLKVEDILRERLSKRKAERRK